MPHVLHFSLRTVLGAEIRATVLYWKFSKSCRLHLTSKKRKEFALKYSPKDVETGRYNWWETRGCFSPRKTSDKAFCIILPPPNITGALHLGHVLTTTVQDVYSRWNRMWSTPVLWIPGMDHAGIATQVVVEKMLLQSKGKTRLEIGREDFLNEVLQWKSEKQLQIRQQLRNLGASVDWSREYFTMDSKQSSAVVEAFIRLYDAGLIYRREALVNWSCCLHSAISDIEIDYKSISGRTKISVPGYDEAVEFGVLHDFAYPLFEKEGELVVSTTRIETMLGDAAVAVHPEDSRYKHLHGAELWHPFRKEKIPIICDTFVDPNFGSGAVKITPAHDNTDYEVSRRHKLPLLGIISENGRLNEKCGKFFGIKRFDARDAIISELMKLKLYRGCQDHEMQIPVCSRSGDVIELLLKPQWFVSCQRMAEKAINAVKEGRLKIEPSRFEDTWFSYLEDIRDWCISRQLWWGHRIPAYQCHVNEKSEHSSWVVAETWEAAQKAAIDHFNCSREQISISQDEDVLDTWFSSALLPFSVLGWPYETEDFKQYFPLSMMETGHDILFFWVARMVMLGEQLTGQLPFKRVVLHGIICDAHGRKMSKSLGNVIHPEHVINGISVEGLKHQVIQSYEAGLISENELQKTLEGHKKLFPSGIPPCGTDALRFSLLSQNMKDFSLNFDVAHCLNSSHLCNKIWQACRYVKIYQDNVGKFILGNSKQHLNEVDRWILSRLATMVINVNEALNDHMIHYATASLRSFIYSNFCDVYLELTKLSLGNPSSDEAKAASWTLTQCVETFLRALSPFMPFLSEELYHQIHPDITEQPVMLMEYPKPEEWIEWQNKNLEKEFCEAISAISAIRQIKSICNIETKKPRVCIVSSEDKAVYEKFALAIAALAKCEIISITTTASKEVIECSVSDSLSHGTSVHVLLNDKVASDRLQVHINKKSQKISSELQKLIKIMSSEGYKSKAAVNTQEQHAKKVKDLEAKLASLHRMQTSLKQISQSRAE